MKTHNIKNVFKDGAISSEFIANSITKHQSKTTIGAHNIFLGQVRADEIDNKTVASIEYTAYEDMANEKFYEIREAAFKKLKRNRLLTPVQRKMKSLRIGANARRIYQQVLIANGVRFKV